MVRIKSAFGAILLHGGEVNVDNCSWIRHLIANAGLCTHVYKRIEVEGLKELWDRTYKEHRDTYGV